MSETHTLLVETAERLCADLASAPDASFASAWRKVEDAGLPALLVPERGGGFGGDWVDAFAVMRLVGAHAVAAPIGEAIVAAHLIASSGFAPRDGMATLAPRCAGALDAQGRFSGRMEAAPWAGDASTVLGDFEGELMSVGVSDAVSAEVNHNPAGEPRVSLVFESAPTERAAVRDSAFACGALMRTAQIAGALDAALAMTIVYANERSQFGKPIGKFQAVQQSLAVFAEEAAAVNCGGQAAARAMDRDGASFEIAAAKLRANMAAGIGAAAAHQVHGAIGFTQEHGLHRLTRRLIAWRSEFGGDRFWAERIGGEVCARGAEAFWPYLTGRSDVA